jgi:ActR/RegA family two-component response regulator
MDVEPCARGRRRVTVSDMPSLPPRVLLIMPDQWPRALLRAALREVGYDALGAPSLGAGLRYRAEAPGRGPVRLVLVDQAALADDTAAQWLGSLIHRHRQPRMLLLTRATRSGALQAAALPWHRVLRRPASIADLVSAIQRELPLAPGAERPLD